MLKIIKNKFNVFSNSSLNNENYRICISYENEKIYYIFNVFNGNLLYISNIKPKIFRKKYNYSIHGRTIKYILDIYNLNKNYIIPDDFLEMQAFDYPLEMGDFNNKHINYTYYKNTLKLELKKNHEFWKFEYFVIVHGLTYGFDEKLIDLNINLYNYSYITQFLNIPTSVIVYEEHNLNFFGMQYNILYESKLMSYINKNNLNRKNK